jgi:hypothetical protein
MLLSPILFNVYSEYLAQDSLEGFGDFKIGGQVIRTADELVLLAKKETVLQVMIDRLIEIGRCFGMENNVGKLKKKENLKATIPTADYGTPKTIGECGIFQIFW